VWSGRTRDRSPCEYAVTQTTELTSTLPSPKQIIFLLDDDLRGSFQNWLVTTALPLTTQYLDRRQQMKLWYSDHNNALINWVENKV
jgi:hypothetical protein